SIKPNLDLLSSHLFIGSSVARCWLKMLLATCYICNTKDPFELIPTWPFQSKGLSPMTNRRTACFSSPKAPLTFLATINFMDTSHGSSKLSSPLSCSVKDTNNLLWWSVPHCRHTSGTKYNGINFLEGEFVEYDEK
ncbi:hypothetical protein KI387_013391, partial [Taxus chinensis]